MAAQAALDRIVEAVNFWTKYIHPDPEAFVPQPADRIHSWYRLSDYPGPGPTFGLPPQATILGPGQPLERPPGVDEVKAHRDFLDEPVPQLNKNPADPLARHWVGTKFLGEGGCGKVGLWEYRDPNPAALPGIGTRRVVVKEGTGLPAEINNVLRREANNHLELAWGGSPHIVSILRNVPAPASILGTDEGLGAEWNGVLRRIYLEYCDIGDLLDLLARRIRL